MPTDKGLIESLRGYPPAVFFMLGELIFCLVAQSLTHLTLFEYQAMSSANDSASTECEPSSPYT